MEVITTKIKDFFTHRHDVFCNQKYAGDLPYSFHLKMVYQQALRFHKYMPLGPIRRTAVLIGLWGHDCIEDARMTYNDVINLNKSLQLQHIADGITLHYAEQACAHAANIIYACTELRGHDRSERHGKEYIETLLKNRDAVFVKLCDIIANVKFSLLENSSMFSKYKSEWEDFRVELTKNFEEGRNYIDEFSDMVTHLDQLLTIN